MWKVSLYEKEAKDSLLNLIMQVFFVVISLSISLGFSLLMFFSFVISGFQYYLRSELFKALLQQAKNYKQILFKRLSYNAWSS